MFKTASDRTNYVRRTGSHATKPSRRGIIHIAPLTAIPANDPNEQQAVAQANIDRASQGESQARPIVRRQSGEFQRLLDRRDFLVARRFSRTEDEVTELRSLNARIREISAGRKALARIRNHKRFVTDAMKDV